MPLNPDIIAAYMEKTKGLPQGCAENELRGWLLDASEHIMRLDAQQAATETALADTCRKTTDRVVGGAYLRGWEACVELLKAKGFDRAARAVTLPEDEDEDEPPQRVGLDPLGDPVAYVCDGCETPIREGEGMIGSDVFGIYAHASCEKLVQEKMREASERARAFASERDQARRTLGRYADDARFGGDMADPMLANLGDCQSPPAASLRVEAEDVEDDS